MPLRESHLVAVLSAASAVTGRPSNSSRISTTYRSRTWPDELRMLRAPGIRPTTSSSVDSCQGPTRNRTQRTPSFPKRLILQAWSAETDVGVLAACYVLLTAMGGPLFARCIAPIRPRPSPEGGHDSSGCAWEDAEQS